MTFIHPILLGGLVLMGIPIIVHLIMRQQPKHLIFPAFRFLLLRQRTNQRKLRLRHLILLALRMALIALMCLALARPKLFSDRFGFLGDEQAATVVLVVDTSPTMDYTAAGNSRLTDAKARAQELLDELGESSRIAVLDTADPVAEWALSRTAARERIANLVIRPGNRPVTEALDVAFRLFGSEEFQNPGDDTKPRFVYVFSDRTPASWDGGRIADLKTRRDRLPDPKPRLVYVDVGVEQPADLAVADLVVKPQAVPANRPVVLNVTVQATGPGGEADLSCRFDGDPQTERKPVRLRSGERQVVTFERRGLKPGYHQVDVSLLPEDSLKGDNVRYATVLVREPRKVLVLCDETGDARVWQAAIDNAKLYECAVKPVSGPEVVNMSAKDLRTYQAVCLLSVADPSSQLWGKLDDYVREGGGLVIAPGASLHKESYNDDAAAHRLLPGQFVQLDANRDGVRLTDYQYQHRLLAPFRDMASQPGTAVYLASRMAFQYWEVKPADGAAVLLHFADKDKHSALLERTAEGGRGKVLLFTTPMDNRQDAAGHAANNFNVEWFYFVLVNETVKYLAGEAEDAVLNYPAGPVVTIPLPPDGRAPTYTLGGPGLTGADTQIQRADSAGELRLTQPQQPGNYVVTSGDRKWHARFSLNVPADEWLLLPRLGTD
ncbi:MAG TPA: BatA and WFA domain-containing protein, partial [Gemmataceae bacterium]|nr:BatA and WFA domain-containing protein [Gemmataceae bacterium]